MHRGHESGNQLVRFYFRHREFGRLQKLVSDLGQAYSRTSKERKQ